MNKKSSLRNKKAFTLIELLVVMAIIGVLVGMIVGMASFAQHKAFIAKLKAEMQLIRRGLESYRAEYGKYPVNATPENSTVLSQALWVKPQAQGLKPFLVLEGWNNPDEAYEIKDPGGQHYRYLHRLNPPYAEHNNSKFGYDLWTVVHSETNPGGWDVGENNWSRE